MLVIFGHLFSNTASAEWSSSSCNKYKYLLTYAFVQQKNQADTWEKLHKQGDSLSENKKEKNQKDVEKKLVVYERYEENASLLCTGVRKGLNEFIQGNVWVLMVTLVAENNYPKNI